MKTPFVSRTNTDGVLAIFGRGSVTGSRFPSDTTIHLLFNISFSVSSNRKAAERTVARFFLSSGAE